MPNTDYAGIPGPLGYKSHGADWNAAINTRALILRSEDGTLSYYLFVDSTGRLRIKSGAPTSATDGTVVGTQT